MAGTLTLQDLRKACDQGEIDTVVACFPDMQGRLVGKRFHAEFFLKGAYEETHGCDYLLANDIDMEPVPGYAVANWERGYGDFIMKPDLATLRRIPWLPATALVLCDVLAFTGPEAADMLDVTPTAVKGLLQRARAKLDEPAPSADDEPELAARFAEAFAADDIDTLLTLLTDDAWLAMPPAPHVYEGKPAIEAFLRASAQFRTWRYELSPTTLNGQPAFDLGRDGTVVLTTREAGISAISRFLPTR